MVGGQRIIDRVAGALGTVVSEYVVVANDQRAAEWIPGKTAISDISRQRGSLVGIHTALSHARQPILLVAWDMPFVTPELLALIRDRLARSAFAAIPFSDAGAEPLCAAYTPACLPWIERALAADDLRLSSMLDHLAEYERIPVDDVRAVGDPARLFFNVNDASDLARAERLAAAG